MWQSFVVGLVCSTVVVSDLYADSVETSHFSPSEIVSVAEIVAKGKIKQILWDDGGKTESCFGYIYKFSVEEVFKGNNQVGDEVLIASNLITMPMRNGDTQVGFLQKIPNHFFDHCKKPETSEEIDFSSVMMFFSTPITVYRLTNQLPAKFEVTRCSTHKQYLFDEEKNPNYKVNEVVGGLYGLNCKTVSGPYEDLKKNITKIISEKPSE